MIGASCPNKSHEDWKDLVKEVGENKAYELYIDNEFNIPKNWKSTNEKELNEVINKFLSNSGITVSQVKKITTRDGQIINANAMADLVYKTIQVVEGKSKVDTLPEEASHFLVAMLRGTQLYNSMYNDVTNYDVYKEVISEYGIQYNNDAKKLKEEAMAKVIASLIVDNFSDKKLELRANSWWNRVLQYLKELFKGNSIRDLEYGIIEHAPFSEAADLVRAGWSREYYPSREDDSFYQLDNQEQNTVISAIENNLGRGSISLEGDGYVVTKPDGTKKEVKNRVSDRVSALVSKFFTSTPTAQQELYREATAGYGTKGHADFQNVINRAVAITNNTIAPGKTENLGKDMYQTIETYGNKFLKSFPAGTKFLTEVTIYDEKADEAGTIDFLAIYPDGSVDIYDWKFQEIKGKKDTKSISDFKKKNWNVQIGRYADILKKVYGIQNVKKKRVIPIETTYDKNVLKSIKIGPVDIESFTSKNDYLKPVPIISEMTGDERLDTLIEDLIRQKEELEQQKPPANIEDAQRDAFFERKRIKVNEINRAIQDIQLTNDIEEYIKRGTRQILDITDTGLAKLTEEELLKAYENTKFYGQRLIIILGDLVDNKNKPYQEALSKLVANSQALQNRIYNEVTKRSKQQNGENITTPQKGAGFWTRNLRTLSQQNHPVLKAFYKLVQGSKEKTRKELLGLNQQISKALSDLREYQSSKGISSENTFDFMLDTTQRVLRLASKYSESFYTERNKQRDLIKNGSKEEKLSALRWFRDNTVFDEERYDKAYEEHKKNMEKVYRNYDKPQEAIKRSLKEFEAKFGDNQTGYANNNNWYVKPKDSHYSQSYQDIQNNDALRNFYNLYTENTSLFRKIIGQKPDARFIWNVKKDFVDSVAENGLASVNPLDFMDDMLKLEAGIKDGNVNPQTGEAEYNIPTYYLEGVQADKQSRDLGRILYMAGSMAYNYKNMAEIEDSTKALELILRNTEEVLTNNNGEDIYNKVTGRLQKVIGSADTIDQFKDYMNYYIYGIKNKSKDFKINILGKDISGLAVYNFINKSFVGKTLALNPVSIVANSVGGDWNARIIGAGGRFYNSKDYNYALKDLGTRDKKSYSIVGLLDILHGESHFKKAGDLSVNFLTRNMSYEKLFIGQEIGDYAIRNSTALAMFRSHTLKDGKIVRKTTEDTSLFDMIEIKDDKLDMKNIPEAELEKFRTKILKVSEDILGNNSRDDIRTAQLTILGRALMTFRSWIPRTIDSRYGELRFSGDIDAYELGRYRSFWNQIMTKQAGPLLLDTIANFGTFGFVEFGNATRERASQLYKEAKLKDPDLTLTEEEYIEIHITNLKANMTELYIVLSMVSLLFMVKPSPDDDDKDYTGLRKYTSRQLDRNLSELLFYYNPGEFNKILKSPIPITRVFSDIFNLFWNVGKEGVGTAIQDDKMKYEARPMKYSLKLFPVLNGLENILSIFDEDYDRDDLYNNSGGKNK